MTTVLLNLLFLSFRHSSTLAIHKYFSSLNVSQYWHSTQMTAMGFQQCKSNQISLFIFYVSKFVCSDFAVPCRNG